MLRVFKPTSPMSIGSWLLTAYGPAAGVAAASAVTGLRPGVGRAATIAAAVTGPGVASSALTRFGIFYAGRTSARDPRCTVGPQKGRIRQRHRREPSSSGENPR